MNFLPKELENVINNYKKEFEIKEKMYNELNSFTKYYLYSYNGKHVYVIYMFKNEIIYSHNLDKYQFLPSYLYNQDHIKKVEHNNYDMDDYSQEIVSNVHLHILKNLKKKYNFELRCDWILLNNNLEQIKGNKKLIYEILLEFID